MTSALVLQILQKNKKRQQTFHGLIVGDTFDLPASDAVKSAV